MHSTARVVPAVAAAAVLLLALTGCSSPAASGSAPSAIPDSLDAAGEDLTVWVMQHDYSRDTLEDTKVGFFQAALNSRSTPAALGWSGIEGENALQTLFSSVASGSANDVLIAYTFMRDQTMYSLPVWLASFSSPVTGTDISGKMAGSVLFSLPVVVFFVLMQRKLVSGMSAGAVKG